MAEQELLDEAIAGFNANFGEHIRLERWGRGYVAWFPWDEWPERLAHVPLPPEAYAWERAEAEPEGSPQRSLAIADALRQWHFDDLINDARVIAAGRGRFRSRLVVALRSGLLAPSCDMVRMPSGKWVSDYAMGESLQWEELANAPN